MAKSMSLTPLAHRRGCPDIEAPPSSRLAPRIAFAAALVMAAGLPTVVPGRLLAWADTLADQPNGALLAPAAVAVAVMTTLTGLRWTLFFILSFRGYRQAERAPTTLDAWPFVSVLVPAYNESETIANALESLTRLDYPHYEIIVVDDGSTDDTFARARRYAGRYDRCEVRVLTKSNGGKWSAHNFALRHARADLLLCVDADSGLEPQALRYMVARTADPTALAVSGQIRVRNRVNTLTRLQGLEYLMGNGSMRMAQSCSGCVLVIPGPIGLFRRRVLEEIHLRWGRPDGSCEPGKVAGPFTPDTFAEDFDLSAAVLTLGERNVYEPRAISRTKAPDWPLPLLNQRYRWSRGTLQVLRKFFTRVWRHPELRHGRVIAWMLGTYVIDLLVMPLGYLIGGGLTATYLLAGGSPGQLLLAYLPFWLMMVNAGIFFTVVHRDELPVLAVLPLYDLYQGLLLNFSWLLALYDEVRGARMRW
ncbi:MAG: glycosyltransferase family 2 protein [Planctomycetota bacterium]